MQDPVTEIFGYILVAVGVLLAVREQAEYTRHRGSLFVTTHRYWRRLVISVILGLIGSLFVVYARQLLPHRVTAYTTFVFCLMSLSLLLLVLVALDALETARNAASHSISELHRAVEEQRLRKLAEQAREESSRE